MLQGIQETKLLRDREINFRLGTDTTIAARAVGVVDFYFDDFSNLVLEDFLFVLKLKHNLIQLVQ